MCAVMSTWLGGCLQSGGRQEVDGRERFGEGSGGGGNEQSEV